jgi:hypothetical protein
MNTIITGQISTVELREVFPHELDFSRWMTENILVLKDLVCFDIDPDTVSQEVTSGSIRVDLVAKATWPNEDKSFPVIIENQLGTTDASHCAGIMAYTAAFKARGAIWIAESASQEYIDVVEWLNAESNIDAYLLVVECTKLDESRPYPFLTRLVGPLRRTQSAGRQGDPERSQKIRNWWAVLLPKLREAHPAWAEWKKDRPTSNPYDGPRIPSASGPIHWYANVFDHRSSIGLWVRADDADEATRCYDLIMERKDEIESSCGLELDLSTMYRRGGTVFIRAQAFDGGYASETATQERVANSIAESMKQLCIATDGTLRIGEES